MSRRTLNRLTGVALATQIVAYLLWRPRMLHWGATSEEASEPLPGDDRTPHPRVQSTRAVTIDAPPERVWPWLMQMGIGRAGFYSHDWVERLMCRARYVEGRHSATRIHPEVPPLQASDTVPTGGGRLRDRAGGTAARVPGRAGDLRAAASAGQQDPAAHPLPRDGIPLTGRSSHPTAGRAAATAHPVDSSACPRR